jgi:hypothetical protein
LRGAQGASDAAASSALASAQSAIRLNFVASVCMSLPSGLQAASVKDAIWAVAHHVEFVQRFDVQVVRFRNRSIGRQRCVVLRVIVAPAIFAAYGCDRTILVVFVHADEASADQKFEMVTGFRGCGFCFRKGHLHSPAV